MLALIVAYTQNNVIGNRGRIPWKITGEQKRFKELTLGNTIIMGRKTFEEIGKPLPNRQTIVISKTKKYENELCTTVRDLKSALSIAKSKDIFIAGGASLYEESIPLVSKMYITKIDMVTEGDTKFPEFREEEFNLIFREQHNEAEIPYTYLTYERKIII